MKNPVTLDQFLLNNLDFGVVISHNGTFAARLLYKSEQVLSRKGNSSSAAYDKLIIGVTLEGKKLKEKIALIDENNAGIVETFTRE